MYPGGRIETFPQDIRDVTRRVAHSSVTGAFGITLNERGERGVPRACRDQGYSDRAKKAEECDGAQDPPCVATRASCRDRQVWRQIL